jgi:tol-pal system protein YbgF
MTPMRYLIPITLTAVVLAGCATTPPEEDPVQIKLNELDTRLAKVERIVENQSLVQLAQQLDSIQNEVRQLRGRVEELENSSEAARKQQRDLYNDLDKRITALQTSAAGTAGAAGAGAGAGAGAAGGAGTASPDSAPVPEGGSVDQTVYNQAFEALKAGSYSVAITSFKDFLTNYPSSPLAENAQYWLGQAYYVNKDFGSAATAFRTVVEKYPNSPKAPDAMLKLGYTQLEQKKVTEGRNTLTQVSQKYPGSEAAKAASERLKKIPAAK